MEIARCHVELRSNAVLVLWLDHSFGRARHQNPSWRSCQ
jgi:hypothetical protein